MTRRPTMLVRLLVVCAAALLPRALEAQVYEALAFAEEWSFVHFDSRTFDEPIILEAKITPHLWLPIRPARLAFDVTPKFVVRILRDPVSDPVRTPSYMPRATVHFWPRSPAPDRLFSSLFLTFSHHSNGQEGPFLDASGRNNHIDGSFSTNYFELGTVLTPMTANAGAPGGVTPGPWGVALSVEWHPGISMDRELERTYGVWRINALTTMIPTFGLVPFGSAGRLRTTLLLGDVIDRGDPFSDRVILDYELRWSPGMQSSFGFYGGAYFGPDYYNIRYDDHVELFRLGVYMRFSSTPFSF